MYTIFKEIQTFCSYASVFLRVLCQEGGLCRERTGETVVKGLSAQCIGPEELRYQRGKIQELSNNTSTLLKRNVYHNYVEFIDTAKEISHLESEMYQLSQLLSEQRTLLNILATNQKINLAFGSNSESDLDYNKHFQALAEIPGRFCLREGPLLELDPLDGKPMKKVYVYLFNDALVVVFSSADSNRNQSQYKMEVVYDLQSLAVINVRDLGSVKLAFKLLAFPDMRIFQCATAKSKKEWLEKYDQAKKLRIVSKSPSRSTNEEKTKNVKTNIFNSHSASLNSTIADKCNESENELQKTVLIPEWILEVNDDLDACIAQRQFEEAYSLLNKSEAILNGIQKYSIASEIKEKLKQKSTYLIKTLTKELELSIEAKSIQGVGLKNARRVVKLLIYFDHSSQACQVYLRICSATLKLRLKRVKREGTMLPYLKHLSAVAFSNIIDILREFLKTFSTTNCYSALVLWCSSELNFLLSYLINQMFLPQISLSTIVDCITTMRDHCRQLFQIGVDFEHQLDSQLRIPLIKALQDTGEKYLEGIKVRAAEDNWQPSHFKTISSLNKLFSELDDLGIQLPDSYARHNCWLPLTSNTLTFGKIYISLFEDCLNIVTPEIIDVTEEVLISVLQAQIQHLMTSVKKANLKNEKKLVHGNAKYIHDVVINRSLELYKSVIGHQFKKLHLLQDQLLFELIPTSFKPQPSPRSSMPKYFTSEYI